MSIASVPVHPKARRVDHYACNLEDLVAASLTFGSNRAEGLTEKPGRCLWPRLRGGGRGVRCSGSQGFVGQAVRANGFDRVADAGKAPGVDAESDPCGR